MTHLSLGGEGEVIFRRSDSKHSINILAEL